MTTKVTIKKSMRLKRFIYVASPGGNTVHVKFGNTSEGPTACGRQAEKGWKYWKRYLWRQTNLKLCKVCSAV